MMSTDNHNLLPHHTTPTWEVELLISGVAVFAMLQLPGWLDDRIFALLPRIGGHWGQLLEMLYIYAKSAAVILAVTFVVHLTLRARWVAIVGLHSVYPGGVLWERLRMGPLQRQIEQERALPDSEVIERADNLATIVFATGVMMAILLLITLVLVGGSYSLALIVTRTLNWHMQPWSLLLAFMAIAILPIALVIAIDRSRPEWLGSGWWRRCAEWVFHGYARVGFSRNSNRIMALLTSHVGERRVMLFTTTIMALVLVAVSMAFGAMQEPTRAGSYALFPASATAGVSAIEAAHYADQRDPARDEPVPFVQSMVAAGPYLQLLVPYRPATDEPALRSECPAIHDSKAHDRARGILACLQRLHPLLLDGKPLADAHYEIASDARTDRPALLAMIDVRALAPGRHELQVGHPPGHSNDHDDADKPGRTPDRADVIPFWR